VSKVALAIALSLVKEYVVAFILSFKDRVPEIVKAAAGPLLDKLAVEVATFIDGISLDALEASIVGRGLELLKTGKGPSASSPVDLA
jgi:hypothetical protein